jgi:hypothetical protein
MRSLKLEVLAMTQLYVLHNGVHFVLDADANNINANGTKVQLYPWNGQPNQKWVLELVDGKYRIRCEASNRVLDAEASHVQQNGYKVQLYDDLGNPNQRWTFQNLNNGAYLIKNAASGKVLDADLNTINTPGVKMQLFDRIPGNANQHWMLSTTSI